MYTNPFVYIYIYDCPAQITEVHIDAQIRLWGLTAPTNENQRPVCPTAFKQLGFLLAEQVARRSRYKF